MESQKKFARTFSFEFFPPQTPEGIEKLRATRRQLAQLDPKFFSVTFGAGGSTRDRTIDTVLEIQAEGYTVAPHLSCIGATGENIRNILKQYRDRGVRHIVALRGDLPSGMAQGGGISIRLRAGRVYTRGVRRRLPYRCGGVSRVSSAS